MAREDPSWRCRVGIAADVMRPLGRRANPQVAPSQAEVPTSSGIARQVDRMATVTSEDDDPHMRGSRSQHESIAMPSFEHGNPNRRDRRSSLLTIAIPP